MSSRATQQPARGARRDVAPAAVALDVLEALHVERVEAAQVALDGVLLHLVAQARQLLLRQLVRALVRDALPPARPAAPHKKAARRAPVLSAP